MGSVREIRAKQGKERLSRAAREVTYGALDLEQGRVIEAVLADELKEMGVRIGDILEEIEEKEKPVEETPPVEETEGEGEEPTST